MTRYEKAVENHKRGYNCAQAVACAFAEDMGVSEDILFRLAEGFGGGLGGALGGSITGASLANGSNSNGANQVMLNPKARLCLRCRATHKGEVQVEQASYTNH